MHKFVFVVSLFVVNLAVHLNRKANAQEPMGVVSEKPDSGLFVEVDGGFMVPYTLTMPDGETTFEMVPIPGGTFFMGSPEDESERSEDEGPQVEVQIAPFWMAKTELTWAEYKQFMACYNVFKQLNREGVRVTKDVGRVDAITVPTPLYDTEHTFAYGDHPQQPAVTMTQYAAKMYTKWLSGLFEQQFRLPTEAEWEYACRAGAETAYSFGEDADDLDAFAYFSDNSDEGAGLVGTKKPNAFGLHDMHGNVWEWVVDSYSEDGYEALEGKDLDTWSAIQWSEDAYPRTVRGGGWQDFADRCRSAARLASEDEDWKDEDPNVPLSPWWFTSDPARMVGMRLVRSYQPLDESQISRFWNYDDPDTELAVEARLSEGRGVVGRTVPDLIEDLKQ